jgi:hypothetical protein
MEIAPSLFAYLEWSCFQMIKACCPSRSKAQECCEKASEKSLLGFFNKDFSKRSAYDPRTSASEKLLFRRFLIPYYCCSLLDHVLLPEALEDFISMVHDPIQKIRTTALHTPACDRSKEGYCRPVERDILVKAL